MYFLKNPFHCVTKYLFFFYTIRIFLNYCFFFVTVYLFVFLLTSQVKAQQQYFRVLPRDLKVQEGGEAMLECEVANLAGQVQWTKDGFALGKPLTRPLLQLSYWSTKSIKLELRTNVIN